MLNQYYVTVLARKVSSSNSCACFFKKKKSYIGTDQSKTQVTLEMWFNSKNKSFNVELT